MRSPHFKLNLALTEFLAAYAENDTDSRWLRLLTMVKDAGGAVKDLTFLQAESRHLVLRGCLPLAA